MLTVKEIDFWDSLIMQSEDLELARKFYPKAGRPERVNDVFRNAARDLADCDILFNEKFEQGTYNPELTDEELKKIAADAIKQDIKNRNVHGIFTKLEYPVYSSTKLTDKTLCSLVNKALRNGGQGYEPGKNPRRFADGLIDAPEMNECPEEVSFTYSIFSDEKYQKFAKPKLAKNIVTLKVFHELLRGRFEEASKIRDKYVQHYDNDLASQLVQSFIVHEAFIEDNYSLGYLVAAQRSSVGDLFPQDVDKIIKQRAKDFDTYVKTHKSEIPEHVDLKKAKKTYLAGYKRLAFAKNIVDYLDGTKEIVPTAKMDKTVLNFCNENTKQQYSQKRGLPYEKAAEHPNINTLNLVFDEAEESCGILVGMLHFKLLFEDENYVKRVGKKQIKDVLNKRIENAIQTGKANVVYQLMFGTNFSNGHKIPGAPHFNEYAKIDKISLLEAVVSELNWNPEHLLSDKYNFAYDTVTRDCSEIDDAYDLYLTVAKEKGKLPSAESMKKLVFLKMAVHIKEHYEGAGMKTLVDVFENPANSAYIDSDQTKRLLTKVFTEYFEKGRIDGIMGAANISYFYTLVNSKLGDLVKDDQRLDPYFKLCQFIESK
jgi:hypothetical protein